MSGRSVAQGGRARRQPDVLSPRPDARHAILEATELALATTALHELSVQTIMAGSGVSRATFYSYFASKFEVVAALFELVMEEMYDLLRPLVSEPAGTPEQALREVLAATTALWRRHGAVLCATHENRHAVPEFHKQWLRTMERFTETVADAVQKEFDAELPPGSTVPRQRAAAVLWSSEYLFYLASTGVDDDLPNHDAILDTLVTLWIGTLYGPVTASGSCCT